MNTLRILVVDDEDSLRMTLAANLELEGIEVIEAENGERALELISQHPVDLVLSDIRMPGLNGVELFRKIKTLHPGIPVLLMTAFAIEDQVESAVQEGAYAVLPKPFKVDDAIEVLVRASKSPCVLVVDDVEHDANWTAEALEAAGMRARAVFKGEDAVRAIGEGNVDVCVTDLMMPGIDGAEVVRRIRELDQSVSLIVFSGHEVPEMMQQVAAGGAFVCLRKPLNPVELIQAIARARAEPKRKVARA